MEGTISREINIIRKALTDKGYNPDTLTYHDLRMFVRDCYLEDGARYVNNITIYGGQFRFTFVMNNCRFVIKAGRNSAGARQCAEESRLYDVARGAGLYRYFAKPRGVCTLGEVDFYGFDKINYIGAFECWFTGIREVAENEHLKTFLAKNHMDNDLHNGNYGQRSSNGHYVLIDYATLTVEDWTVKEWEEGRRWTYDFE